VSEKKLFEDNCRWRTELQKYFGQILDEKEFSKSDVFTNVVTEVTRQIWTSLSNIKYYLVN